MNWGGGGNWQRGLEPSLHDRPSWAPVKKFCWVRLSTNFPSNQNMADNADLWKDDDAFAQF